MVNGPASGGDKTNVPGDWRQQPAFMMRTEDTSIHTNTGPGLRFLQQNYGHHS